MLQMFCKYSDLIISIGDNCPQGSRVSCPNIVLYNDSLPCRGKPYQMHTTSTIDSNMAVFKAAMKTGTIIMAMVIILILYKLTFNLANLRKK